MDYANVTGSRPTVAARVSNAYQLGTGGCVYSRVADWRLQDFYNLTLADSTNGGNLYRNDSLVLQAEANQGISGCTTNCGIVGQPATIAWNNGAWDAFAWMKNGHMLHVTQNGGMGAWDIGAGPDPNAFPNCVWSPEFPVQASGWGVNHIDLVAVGNCSTFVNQRIVWTHYLFYDEFDNQTWWGFRQVALPSITLSAGPAMTSFLDQAGNGNVHVYVEDGQSPKHMWRWTAIEDPTTAPVGSRAALLFHTWTDLGATNVGSDLLGQPSVVTTVLAESPIAYIDSLWSRSSTGHLLSLSVLPTQTLWLDMGETPNGTVDLDPAVQYMGGDRQIVRTANHTYQYGGIYPTLFQFDTSLPSGTQWSSVRYLTVDLQGRTNIEYHHVTSSPLGN